MIGILLIEKASVFAGAFSLRFVSKAIFFTKESEISKRIISNINSFRKCGLYKIDFRIGHIRRV